MSHSQWKNGIKQGNEYSVWTRKTTGAPLPWPPGLKSKEARLTGPAKSWNREWLRETELYREKGQVRHRRCLPCSEGSSVSMRWFIQVLRTYTEGGRFQCSVGENWRPETERATSGSTEFPRPGDVPADRGETIYWGFQYWSRRIMQNGL